MLTAQIDKVDNEIILVNDGSTDNSLEICEQYASKNKNIKVFSQENQGQSVARNLGIEKAIGEYITFVDSDDYVEKNYFKEIFTAQRLYPKIDIIVFGYFKVKNKNRTENYSITKFGKEFHKEDIKILLENTIDYNYLLYAVNKIYKKKLIISSGLFSTNLRLGEDTIFNLKVFYHSSSIIFVQKSIYNYYYNPDSVTNQKYRPNLIYQMEEHFQTKLNFYRSKSDLNKEVYFKDIALVNLEKTFYAFLGNILADQNLDFIEELKKIQNLDLIKFGFEHTVIMEIRGKKKKLILWLFKNKLYNLIKFIYLKKI